jgi:acetolactate synthase-1/2/3 large subunit
MGYSLPAAIGAAIANPKTVVICIIGDGGFQINVQELAVIQKHKLNIKIFVLNNHCHGIIQGTQDAWLDGRHHAACPIKGDLPDPNITHIALAYGISAKDVLEIDEINAVFPLIFNNNFPELINVHMKRECQIEPKLMYGRSIEDSHPLLSREELAQNMLPATIE